MAEEHTDLSIVGIEAASKDDAHDVVDEIDALVDQGTVTIREMSMAYKTKHGRTKVSHVSDHGAGIGALVGAGWGVATLGAGIATGAVAIAGAPIIAVATGVAIGLGLDTAIGAAIGKAFNLHHEAGGKVLKAMSDHVEAGHAVVYVVVDPANAGPVADAFDGRTVHHTTITGEEQQKLAAELQESA